MWLCEHVHSAHILLAGRLNQEKTLVSEQVLGCHIAWSQDLRFTSVVHLQGS